MNDNERNTNHARERIRIGRDYVEIDVEGSEDYVERRMNNAMRQVSDSIEIIQHNLFLNQSLQEPQKQLQPSDDKESSQAQQIEHLVDNETVVNPDKHLNGRQQIMTLVDYFLLKSPTSQSDQVMVIASYYHECLNREHLTLDDYVEAFDVLKKVPVATPSNMKSSVRNVVDRTNYMFNPERGLFALTLEGKKYVAALGEAQEMSENGIDAPRLEDKSASIENDDESLSTNKESSKSISNNGHKDTEKTELAELIELYLSLNLKSQREELLLTTHFFIERMGYEHVTMDNYRAAYDVLADVPVKEPKNFTARLQENVDAEFMRSLGNGTYKLTVKGKREVEKWLHESK